MKNKLFLLIFSLLFASGLKAQNLDLKILEQINSPADHGDKEWLFLTNHATYIDAAVPAGMLIAGFIDHDNNLKMMGYKTGASIIIAGGSAFVLKYIVRRQRPYFAHPNLITAKVNETDYSFPSGHSSLAFATATSLSLAYPKWYVIAPSFLYASAVGYSRLYLGVHYPSDVLGGAVVGILSSYITWNAQRWLDRKRHR